MGRLELGLLFWVSRLSILFLLPLITSDIPLYMTYVRDFLDEGKWPYRDFSFEYPPLAFALLAIPGWVQRTLSLSSDWSFRNLFAIPILAVDFLLFRNLLKFPPIRGAAFYYILLTSILCTLLFDRFDLLMGFFVAWPFLQKSGDGKESGFAWSWGIGGALKLVPFVLLPLRLLSEPGFSVKRAWRLGWPAIGCLVLSIGIAESIGDVTFLTRHTDRGVQIESIMGNLSLVAQAKGDGEKLIDYNFGAQHLRDPGRLQTAAKLLFWGTLLGTLLALTLLRARLTNMSATWLLLLGFITFGYVLSPQFLFWVLPLSLPVAAQLEPRRRRIFLLVFAAVVAATGIHFLHYWSYVAMNPWCIALVCVRNMVLVGLFALSWAWLPMRRPLP